MIIELVSALGFLAFGAFLAVHCSREAGREFRSGTATGEYSEFRRSTEPVEFWFIIAATSLAAVMGFLFMAVGLVELMRAAQ